MSQLICPARTYVSSIPLHRRIVEVMKEKGPHYSQQAMAKRLGISRETFRHMLNGEREIYQFELDKIAKDLKVSVERLTQEDVQNDVLEMRKLLKELSDNLRAVELANSFFDRAIGETEKCDAHIFVGRAYFELSQYEEAHEHRLAAYSCALKLQEKYGEAQRLHEAVTYLITSYTVRKDYLNAKGLVDQVQDLFETVPSRFGEVCYALAMIAYNSGKFDEARSWFIQSLESYQQTYSLKEIGRAQHCVAFIEYKMSNYIASKEMFEKAIHTLNGLIEPQLSAIKDYVKVLFMLNEFSLASDLIDESLDRLQFLDLPMLRIKFQLLGSIAKNDPTGAVHVLDHAMATSDHKILACKILLHHHKSQKDALSFMRYYSIMETLTQNNSDIRGEGDL